MKGKNKFIRSEIKLIEELIRKKVRASPSDQKRIRDKIREIGFYYSEFRGEKKGYDVADFRELILSGEIIAIHDNSVNNSDKKEDCLLTVPSQEKIQIYESTIVDIESDLILKGRFLSASYADRSVPNETGYYCIQLSGRNTQNKELESIVQERQSRIIYIGVAEKTKLDHRLLQNELRGVGHGTFFRSIGAILGFLPIPGCIKRDSKNNNYVFSNIDKRNIVEWINVNLEISWVARIVNNAIEKQLIRKYCPPLNIKHNPRKWDTLKVLRKKCIRIGRGDNIW